MVGFRESVTEFRLGERVINMNRESEFHGRVGLVIARTNDELLVGYEQSHLWDQAYGEELEEPRYLLPMSAFRREKAA